VLDEKGAISERRADPGLLPREEDGPFGVVLDEDDRPVGLLRLADDGCPDLLVGERGVLRRRLRGQGDLSGRGG
jgi:hypothetical protein